MKRNEANRHVIPCDGTVLALPCSKLVDHPLRLNYYNQTHLAGLTQSIKQNGLLEPILVKPLDDVNYQILNGHYRVRAVRQLRCKTISSHIYPCDERGALVIFCTSNLLTKSLSALEEAMMMQGLIKQGGFSMAEVGHLWGHSKSWVSRRLKLLTSLEPMVKHELDEGHIRPRLAQELARLPQGNDQTRVLALVKQHYLTKDQTAHLIDWWQEATDDERLLLEKQGGLPLPPPVFANAAHIDKVHYAMRSLKSSTLNIRQLTGFLSRQEPPFNWWPCNVYQAFEQAVKCLADAVSSNF